MRGFPSKGGEFLVLCPTPAAPLVAARRFLEEGGFPMRSKLAARILAAALLAALLNVPAHAAPAPGRPALQAASWWDWLERLPQKVLREWLGKTGGGIDPDGIRGKQGAGVDPDGSTSPAPAVPPGNEAGFGVDPDG